MIEDESPLDQRIAQRVAALRGEAGLSLQALADRSGVSRSMLSLIERGECSATAVVLEKVATGLGVMLADLFDRPAATGPLSRRASQPEWRDPASGYLRRNVSPAWAARALQIVEVEFPPGARVAFESEARQRPVHQQVWLLDGQLDIHLGGHTHHLQAGDCLALQLDQPIVYANPTAQAARYAVVITAQGPAHP